MVGKRGSLIDRFEAKFVKGAKDECWIWQASDNGAGYGMIWDQNRKRRLLATRVSYELYTGPLTDADLVLHSCDNPSCVNPNHLRIGTYKQNVADMDARRRRVSNTPKGALNCNAALTDEQVVKMRLDYLAGRPKSELASENGMTIASVGDVLLGRSWRHLLGINGAPSLEELKAYAKVSLKSSSKIDQGTAEEIRRRLSKGEKGKDIAIKYGLHKATISDIKLRKIWP